MKRAVTLATVILVGLAVVFAVLAVIAKLFFAGDGFSQGLLLALGASAFGSGLTFFLMKISSFVEEKGHEAKKSFEVELTRR